MPRVVLAMSGGVDSSVAAVLLRREGYDVVGLFMRHGEAEPVCTAVSPGATAVSAVRRADSTADRSAVHESTPGATGGGASAQPPVPDRDGAVPSGNSSSNDSPDEVAVHESTSTPPQRTRWLAPPAHSRAVMALPVLSPPAHKQGCCSASDAHDARRVADRLGIPFYALDFQAEFGRIVDYFVDEYSAGRTPNPCVQCNNWLKFGKLREYADAVGAEAIATGHYARLVPAADGPALRRGLDPAKDQSYVLFGIDRRILPRLLFPVGGYRKEEIRALAREAGLRVADKPDSQEICFVPDGDYAAFVRRRGGAADRSGEIVTTSGEVVGRHAGIEGFTIGQRKGLGVARGRPQYVVRIEADSRRVVIGEREELACTVVTARQANWLIEPPTGPLRCEVKIRYLSQPVRATVEPLPENRLRATFDEAKHGVAPGQALVLYDGDRVLGGGWME